MESLKTPGVRVGGWEKEEKGSRGAGRTGQNIEDRGHAIIVVSYVLISSREPRLTLIVGVLRVRSERGRGGVRKVRFSFTEAQTCVAVAYRLAYRLACFH